MAWHSEMYVCVKNIFDQMSEQISILAHVNVERYDHMNTV